MTTAARPWYRQHGVTFVKAATFLPALILCLAAWCAAAGAAVAAPKSADAAPLSKKLTNVQLDGNSLWDALLMIQEKTGVKVNGAWNLLEETGVTRASKITAKLPSISAGGLMDVLCRLVADKARLSWTVTEEGQVMLTTYADLAESKTLKVYPVKGLGLGRGVQETQLGVEFITRFVPEAVESMKLDGANVAVTVYPDVHEKISQLLRYARQGMTAEDWSALLGVAANLRSAKVTIDAAWQAKPFYEAVATISEAAEVPILLDTISLSAADFDPNKPVTLNLKDAQPEKALAALLRAASTDNLKLAADVIAHGEVMLITTANRAEPHLIAITPSPVIAARLSAKTKTSAEIIEKVQKGLGEELWAGQNNRGEIALVGPRFLCRQTLPILCHLAEVMDDATYQERNKKAGVTKTSDAPAAAKPAEAAPRPPVHAATSQAASQPAAPVVAESPAATKLRLANTYTGAGLKSKARQILQSIVDDYPDSPEAKTAKTLLAEE